MRATGMALLGIAAAAGYGCTCGGGPEPDAGVPPKYTADNLCQELAKRQCDFYVRCQADPAAAVSNVPIAAEDAGFGVEYRVPESERARCEAALSSSIDCRAVAASLRDGRTRLDEASVDSCLDTAWPKDTCVRDAVGALKVCQPSALVHANVALGSACSSDRECDGGYCNAASLETCGSCAAPGTAANAPCTKDSMCDRATLWCDGTDGGVCKPYTALNTSCNIMNLEECGPGRVCALVGSFIPLPKCIVGHKEGEPCTMNRYECLRDASALTALVCAPTPVSGGGTADKCVKIQSLPGGLCGGGEGAAFGFDTPFCPETQYCVSGTCTNRLGLGVTCSASDQCAAGLRCQAASDGGMTCEPFSGVEGPCAGAVDCQALLACPASGSCQPRLALVDEPCSADRECANGFCAGGGACAPLGDAGVSCGSAPECASNVCSTTCQVACWE